MNRADIRVRLTAALGSAGIENYPLIEILCDYGLELQEVLKKLEYAYEIVAKEASRTNKYYTLRRLTEDILLDHKHDILDAIDELKKEKE